MEHLDFLDFSNPVDAQLQALLNDNKKVIAVVDVSDEELWQTYLKAYPAEVNTIFRERLHYDGTYDKQYVRRVGRIVAIDSKGKMETIWNVKVPGYFQQVADAMNKLILRKPIKHLFLTDQPIAGSKPNKDNTADIIWTHFYSILPSRYVKQKSSIPSVLGTFQEDVNVFVRGLNELTIDALETVLELINANTLYRGAEFKQAVSNFLELKRKFATVPAKQQEAWIWYTAKVVGPSVRFKNTVIGTLIEDLSAGTELEKAVASYESKVAPQNYKRTTALVTPKMIEQAKQTIQDLGLSEALNRRFATINDISVNNVLFTNENAITLDVFDELKDKAVSTVDPKSLAKVEEISIDHFLTNIVPSASTIEVLFENKHINNLMSLTTSVNPDAPHIFKWDNNFALTYNGDVADSLMKERVKAFGGNTDGVLRFSIQWNTPDQPNTSDLDAHAYTPNGHIYFANLRDNGSGTLDVDIRYPCDKIAVENIIYTDINKMKEGLYTFKVHNFSQRSGKGFTAEIEFDGIIYSYANNEKLHDHAYCEVAQVQYSKKDGFKLLTDLTGHTPTRSVWNLDTNHWVKVNRIMLSPNVWDEQKRTGNEHLLFIIDNCKNPSSARGIYNEFLRPELEPHRKVFELLGERTKVPYTEHQASGLGFSSTKRDKITVRVTGKTKRTFVINL